nr:MAG TPA: hypothetical protein [Bacteriophage sp.]DAN17029.1 MAG TPA: hypothetical protein [Bacteriophage sp.]
METTHLYIMKLQKHSLQSTQYRLMVLYSLVIKHYW